MTRLSMLVVVSLIGGCLDPGADDDEVAQDSSELTVGGRYCVVPSSIGAFQSNLPAGPPACTGFGSVIPVNSSLSGGQSLIISANCGNPNFVNGRHTTNGSYYLVRASSLRPC